jgi:hypothetical protein
MVCGYRLSHARIALLAQGIVGPRSLAIPRQDASWLLRDLVLCSDGRNGNESAEEEQESVAITPSVTSCF